MKIIDCFLFYNELDMLTYRLNVLNDVVDYFIIVESTHTFAGHPKELFYKNNQPMFGKFNSKIIHVIVDDFPHIFPDIDYNKKEQWMNEKFQRNCGIRGLSQLSGLHEKDMLIVADIDEVPDPRIISIIKEKKHNIEVASLEMHFYYYNLHTKIKTNWYHAKIISIGKLKKHEYSIEDIRFLNCKYIRNCGWHLSYFGDVSFIQNKLHNFSHQEFNTVAITNGDVIRDKISTRTNLFDDVKLEHRPIENNEYLPVGYETYLEKFI
jgi:beta-1,4-mannosyl-glycoprotein beta-1,4-N-acetylglucosaminyltransferase